MIDTFVPANGSQSRLRAFRVAFRQAAVFHPARDQIARCACCLRQVGALAALGSALWEPQRQDRTIAPGPVRRDRRFERSQKPSSLIGDLPTVIVPQHERVGKNIELWCYADTLRTSRSRHKNESVDSRGRLQPCISDRVA